MILLIDNYDSFVHNLARYFKRLGQQTVVVRNDAISVADARRMLPDAIVLSPGPCTPQKAGISLELVRQLHREMPILGICLGHQAIAEALGGHVGRAQFPMHGRTSLVQHNGRGIFSGVDNPLSVCRYHSLVVDEATLPPELEVTCRTDDGVIMAIEHRRLPVVGLQFHPESVLTDCGYQLLTAFLRRAGIRIADDKIPDTDDELAISATETQPLPEQPVTF